VVQKIIRPVFSATDLKCDGSAFDHLFKDGVSEDQFVAVREARGRKLAAPQLLLPSIQVNIRAGKLPPANRNGVHYLKIPVRLSA